MNPSQSLFKISDFERKSEEQRSESANSQPCLFLISFVSSPCLLLHHSVSFPLNLSYPNSYMLLPIQPVPSQLSFAPSVCPSPPPVPSPPTRNLSTPSHTLVNSPPLSHRVTFPPNVFQSHGPFHSVSFPPPPRSSFSLPPKFSQ